MTMESPCGDSWQALGTLLSALVTCPFCIRTAAGGSEGSSNCPATLPCELGAQLSEAYRSPSSVTTENVSSERCFVCVPFRSAQDTLRSGAEALLSRCN